MNRPSKFPAAASAPAGCGNNGAASCSPVGAAPTSTCPSCDGFGEVELLALDATRPAIVTCDECEGAGEVPATCGTCEGPLDEGFCVACDDFGWPEDVRAQFASLFGTPEGWSRVEL